MTRLFGAFIAVIAATAAALGYLAVFSDEFDPRDPANVGAGLRAPMYRHWIEYIVIVWTTLLTTAIGYYLMLGPRCGIEVNWTVARRFFFRLHGISGAVILTGLLLAITNGQAVQRRDSITAVLGIGILAVSALERARNSRTG